MTKWIRDQEHKSGQIGQGYSTTPLTYSFHSRIEVLQGTTEYATGAECKATLEDNANYR